MDTPVAQDTTTTRRIEALIAHYGESHRHATNEAIHCVCVPLIMFSLVGLVYAAHPAAAAILLLASLIYYARLSWRALLLMGVWSWALWMGVMALDERLLPVCSVVFVLAWIGQFIGHKLEGKKPSFFEDIQYLWVGPLFVAQVLLQRFGWRW
jgi:uncharacterized membrane protein YGL010W